MSPFRFSRFAPALTILLLTALLLGGCAEPTVDEMRAGYNVELNSWMAQPIEAPVETTDETAEGEGAMEEAPADDASEGEDAEGETAEGEGMEGEAAMEEAAAPQATDILFDVVVRYNGLKALPGITLDVSHADSSQQEKAVYYHWVDTSSLLKGEPFQESFKLEGVPFEEGDLFSVSIREYVEEGDRGNYREFTAAP